MHQYHMSFLLVYYRHYACEEGNFQAATLLMKYGASINHKDTVSLLNV